MFYAENIINYSFLNGPTPASFCLFSFFPNTNCTEQTVGFSGIQTRIVGIEVEHTYHLTTTTAQIISFRINNFTFDSNLKCFEWTKLFVFKKKSSQKNSKFRWIGMKVQIILKNRLCHCLFPLNCIFLFSPILTDSL